MKYSRWTWWAIFALMIGVPTIPNHGWQGVIAGIILGLYWALFTPVILTIVRRHPFSRTHWPKPAILHALLMMASAIATTFLDVIIVAISQWPTPGDPDLKFSQSIAITIPIYFGIAAIGTILEIGRAHV